ncbi:hypothetical protein ACL9RL_18425 [Plantibacter sp. Mn2098]|uniref:hypothetical protein n=1 Tax=Plantibacter sp. Mn2098 TaxID=3395266 RepID=UPI003BEB02A0
MDIEQIARAAAAELDQARDAKVKSITDLASSAQRVADARAAVVDAEREHAKAYQVAERAGWDEKTVRKLGIDVPQRRAGGRPRAARKDATADSSTDA